MTSPDPRTSARAFGLVLDPEDLSPPGHAGDLRERDAAQWLMELARGLASSPAWTEMPDAIMVVRTQPPMGLALIGRFSPAEVARIEMLPAQVRSELQRLRYVTYDQAEDDAAVLGWKLIDRFGASEVRDFRYVAIPRGGLIVLGMLSYVLGLGAEALSADKSGERPLVVVDDTALTGYRFGQFLRRRAESTVVFAHLYSHPDLRTAIRHRERRVVDVVGARDLTDFAPEIEGEEHAAWRERWMRRADGACYWVGRPEHVCYPWAEPDLAIWNPVSDREEPGWRVMPPSKVLKNRFGNDGSQERVQVQPASSGPIRVADRTFHGTLNDAVVAANLGSGEVVVLRDVAGEIWQGIAGGGTLEDAVRQVSGRYEVPAERVREDAGALLRSLTARGLLVAGPAETPERHG